MNRKHLGQYFTPSHIVSKMIELCSGKGRWLEPSAGENAFYNKLPSGSVGIEIDPLLCQGSCMNIDFFEYPVENKFETIIGNPPYVRYQDICESTKNNLGTYRIDGRTNLYISFIMKCIDHLMQGGELIMITPRDFVKSSSATRLNEIMWSQGALTHFIESGDTMLFDDASVNSVIWRWVKGRTSRELEDGRTYSIHKGHLSFFSANQNVVPFSDLFEVKVGAISGCDKVFNHSSGVEFVISKTAVTGEKRLMIYDVAPDNPQLLANKDLLLKRATKNESNWWSWTRRVPQKTGIRIYVNTKTRNKKPFFVDDCPLYDGSVLAIFPRDENIDVKVFCEMLNNVPWKDMGFVVGGRFLFTQRSLENCLLPQEFMRFINASYPKSYCA